MKDNESLRWILIAAALVVFFSGYGMMGFPSWGMMGNYGFSGMWIFGWLFMTLIFVALVLLIAWLIKQIQK